MSDIQYKQTLINSIMRIKYENDDPASRAFLESLTIDELQNLSDEVLLEEKI